MPVDGGVLSRQHSIIICPRDIVIPDLNALGTIVVGLYMDVDCIIGSVENEIRS